METTVIVSIAGFALTVLINMIALSFYAGSVRQTISTLAATVEKHDAKLESHGAKIEAIKSDVRIIGVESGAAKYVQQIS